MIRLLIEGWRSSPHSYALVNQHQSLCLVEDSRFSVYHTDVPFFKTQWEQIDAGFDPAAKATLQSLRPPEHLPVDRIYRVSWPLRVYKGRASQTFVFGTCELGQFPPNSLVGPDGDDRGVDRQAVHLVTSSRWSKNGFLAVGFKDEQVHTIPLGIDPGIFAVSGPTLREKIRGDLSIPKGAFVFLNVSAMTWNKGVGPLVAAFARHRMKNDNAVLVLKGSDALYDAQVGLGVAEAKTINPDVMNPKVVSSIRYLPHNLSQTLVAALYGASDVYVSPYRAEGFNLPVLEALAAGLPVIVTGGGATDDFCPADYTCKIEAVRVSESVGTYLEPNIDSIVDQMQRVTDEAAEFLAKAIAGRADILDRYSWKSVTRKLGDLFAA